MLFLALLVPPLLMCAVLGLGRYEEYLLGPAGRSGQAPASAPAPAPAPAPAAPDAGARRRAPGYPAAARPGGRHRRPAHT